MKRCAIVLLLMAQAGPALAQCAACSLEKQAYVMGCVAKGHFTEQECSCTYDAMAKLLAPDEVSLLVAAYLEGGSAIRRAAEAHGMQWVADILQKALPLALDDKCKPR